MRKILLASAAATALMATGVARAAVNLDFEGVNATYPSGYAFINQFYNGGTSSDGTTGTNFGVTFPANAQAICLNTIDVNCSNTSRGGLGDPASQRGGLFFTTGSQTYVNVAAGFDTGFSFFYSAISQGGSVEVWDGLDGTGALLATLDLSTTPSACGPEYGAGFCPFAPVGVSFNGVARSINFGGVANQIVFDDVTFGSVTPGNVVPEPASLLLLGTAVAGVGLMRRRRR